MKIILISSGVFSIPTMHHLADQKMLHTVVCIGKTNKNTALVELNANYLNIPFRRFLKEELTTGLEDLLNEAEPFVVFVFGCPYKYSFQLAACLPRAVANVLADKKWRNHLWYHYPPDDRRS